jgi:hypothetical protein
LSVTGESSERRGEGGKRKIGKIKRREEREAGDRRGLVRVVRSAFRPLRHSPF